MPMRDRARWAFVILLSMVLLSAPAIWNRFPLLQYDTGGYLARWYEPYLVPSLAATVAGLSVFTTLPWLTSILLTDIFAGLAVLALYLLLLRVDALTRLERV